MQWRPGAIDDLALLRDQLGLPGAKTSYDGGLPSLADSAEAARELTSAAELPDYLLRRIAVTSAGGTCVGKALPITSLVREGVTLQFRCPAAVEKADIVLRTLTDLHPAYRTLATGPGGQRAVYDISHESHAWSASSTSVPTGTTSSTGRSAAIQLSVVGGIGIAFTLAITVLRRRRNQKERVA